MTEIYMKLGEHYEFNIFSTTNCQVEIKRGGMFGEKAIFDAAADLFFSAFSLDLLSFFVFPDSLKAFPTLNL